MSEATILSEQNQKVEGTILETLPDARFRVELDGGKEIIAYLSGKMRLHYIRVMVGDRVALDLSPDGERGRITYRK